MYIRGVSHTSNEPWNPIGRRLHIPAVETLLAKPMEIDGLARRTERDDIIYIYVGNVVLRLRNPSLILAENPMESVETFKFQLTDLRQLKLVNK